MRLKNINICFVTSKEYPNLTDSDQIAASVLQSEGARIIPAIWDDPAVDWSVFDAIILRSTWDYHLHQVHFIVWLDALERQHCHVWNPLSILRWNIDKRYLLDVQRNDIQIPRTRFLDRKNMFNLAEIKALLGVDEVVVKPVISASAWNTWRCSLNTFSDNDRQRLDNLLCGTSVIIQEYMPEISAEGEWSLIFFGKEFSHAVRKFPAEGDFRVQEELGGRYRLEPNPPADLIRQANNVLKTISDPLLYARVDGIVRGGKFILMELELVEPALFFDVDPSAAKRFCERVVEVTKGRL